MKKQAQQEAEHFEGPVLEYGRMTTALKTALNKRNEKKITYLTAAHDLEAKRAHHSKVDGMGGDRKVRIFVLSGRGVQYVPGRLRLVCQPGRGKPGSIMKRVALIVFLDSAESKGLGEICTIS